jgi:hypothetical protein
VAGLQITQEFNEPFNQSTATLPSSFSPSVIGIAGVPYLIDNASGEYQRQAFDVVQQRNTTSNRDILLLPQDVWREQVQSWHYGAGQETYDRDDTLPYRFEDSFGIDPWVQFEISMQNETVLLHGTGNLTGTTWLTTYGAYLAVVNDESIYWFDEMSVGSAAVGSVSIGSSSPVVDVANFAPTVLTLHQDGHINSSTWPGGGTGMYTTETFTSGTFIEWQKDYLFVGDGNVLKSVNNDNTSDIIFTAPDPDFRWYGAAAGNSCIYVLGRDANQTVIHRVGIKSDGTGLNPCIVAATLPDGETGYSIDSYLGFTLIGTDKGVRVAQAVNDSGDLVLGSILPTADPVYSFEGQDRFVWYGNNKVTSTYSTLDDEDGLFPIGTVSGLSRMDLSVTTVNALTPAYATDLVVIDESDRIVRSIKTYLDTTVFSLDDAGVWYKGSNKMGGAWLKQGTVTYGVEDLKTGLYEQANWIPDCAGQVGFDAAYDSSGFVRTATITVNNTTRSGNISLNGTQFSRFNPRFVLYRCSINNTKAPALTRWEIRSIPVKGSTSRWTLPIMNYEEVEIDMVKYTRDPLAALNVLLNLVQSSQLFVLQESGTSYQVHAKSYVWRPEKLTVNGRSWQGVFVLVVEEVQ